VSETDLMKLSLVANDRVSLFSFCSKPDPMPNATDCITGEPFDLSPQKLQDGIGQESEML
jgi:hypothetical protein